MRGDVRQLLLARRYSEAFEQMLDLHEQQVFRMAPAMLRDRGRAEDATQDVFLKLWRALPSYDGRALPSTWLYAIARNTCLTALRAESSRRTLPLENAPESFVSPTPLTGVDALPARLPDDQRLAITLFYWQDQSVRDVAADARHARRHGEKPAPPRPPRPW